MKKKPKKKRIRKMRVYVDVGSHGYPFMFESGPIGLLHPTLLHVYHKRLTPDLKPATLIFEW